MQTIRRSLSLLLVILLTFSILLAGCKGSGNAGTESKPETGSSQAVQSSTAQEALKPVTLKAMLLGNKQKDSEEVWAKFNDELGKVLPNTTVEFDMLWTTEYAQKWDLMMAAGERVDLAWTGWLVPFSANVTKGAFLPLDELIDQYAPILWKSLPEWILDTGKAPDGKIYGVPIYQMMASGNKSLAMSKELADKYPSHVSAIRAAFGALKKDSDFDAYKNVFNTLEAFFADLKNNNDLKLGFSSNIFLTGLHAQSIYLPFMIKNGDPELKAYNYHETELGKLEFDTYADWYKKSYIRKDIATVKNLEADRGKVDGYSVWNDFYLGDGAGIKDTLSTKYGFEVEIIPMRDYDSIASGTSATSTCIPFTSEHPERAMMLLGALSDPANKELYNLLVYGLENKHYKKISENRIELFPDAGVESDKSYGVYKWVVANTMNSYELSTEPENYNQWLDNVHKNAEPSLIMGFSFNRTEVEDYIAQISAVKKEFDVNKFYAFPDHEALYQQYVAKLKTAGADKVLVEIQKQIDTFAKERGIK